MKSLFSLEQLTKVFPRLKRKQTKSSQYAKRLNESRKLRKFYGELSLKYLQTLYKKSYCPSETSLYFFSSLESRLDVVLFRAHFFESIVSAKQKIRSGGIQVNNKKVISPGHNLLPGDIISVLDFNGLDAKQRDATLFLRLSREAELAASQSHLGLPPVLRFSLRSDAGNVKKNQQIINADLSLPRGWRFQRSPFQLSLNYDQQKKAVSCEATIPFYLRSCVIHDLRLKTLESNVINRLSKISFKEFVASDNKKNWCFQNALTFRLLFSLKKQHKLSTKEIQKLFDSLCQRHSLQLGITGKNLLAFTEGDSQDKGLDLFKELFSMQKGSAFFAFHSQGETEIEKKKIVIKKENIQNSVGALISSKNDQTIPNPSLWQNYHNFFPKNFSTYLLKKRQNIFQISNWLFLNLTFLIKNQSLKGSFSEGKRSGRTRPTISSKKKLSCFFQQKKQKFFKEQFFFMSKKIKPLHLEISYKSRSIVFLFPPQRICFPNFINLSHIFK